MIYQFSSGFYRFLTSSIVIGLLSLPALGSVPEKVDLAKMAVYELQIQRSEDKHQRSYKFAMGNFGRDTAKRSTAFFISQNLAVTTTSGVLEEYINKRLTQKASDETDSDEKNSDEKENNEKDNLNLVLRNGDDQVEVKEIVAFSYMEGLALLRVEGYEGPYLEIADSLEKNARLYMAGYIGGMSGIYLQVGKLEIYEHLMIIPINDSFTKLDPESLWGAPILNREGKVVGVNAINKMSFNIAFAIDLELFNRFLEREQDCEKIDVESCVFNSLEHLSLSAKKDRYSQYLMGILFIDSFKNIDYVDDSALRDSFKWIEKSAEQGFAPAQFILCMMYLDEKGVDKNINLAFYWCSRSAKQKFLLARYMLGLLYAKGPPEIRDMGETMLLMGMSAQQGLSYAQFSAALLWFFGEGGVEQNIEMAFVWISRAVENGLFFAEKWLLRYKYMIKHLPINGKRIFQELGPELNIAFRKHFIPSTPRQK